MRRGPSSKSSPGSIRLYATLILCGVIITGVNFWVYVKGNNSNSSSNSGESTANSDATEKDGHRAMNPLDATNRHHGVGGVIRASDMNLIKSITKKPLEMVNSGGKSGEDNNGDVAKEKVIGDERGEEKAEHEHHTKKHAHHKKGHHHQQPHGRHPHNGGHKHHVHNNAEKGIDGKPRRPSAEEPETTPAPHTSAPSDNNKAESDSSSGEMETTGDGRKKKKKKEHRPKYVAHDSNRTNFHSMSYDEALHKYQQFMAVVESEDIEQSSRKFKDYIEKDTAGVKLPTDPAEVEGRFGLQGSPDDEAVEGQTKPYCDPSDFDFTPEKDSLCMRYLMDIRNMQSIKPMSSILSTGRTIKFKVYYKHNNIAAALKVSQKKFALEPASEVMGYHVDRVFEFNRVPPVVWTPIPVDFLKAGAATMDSFYSQWFQRFVLNYTTTQPLLTQCYSKGQLCVNVSMQIWMLDVHDADETELKPRAGFEKYITLPKPDHVKMTDITPGKKQHKLLGELTDLFMFDYIIGNTDRWFGHNSFVVGASKKKDLPAEKRTKSVPRFAYIDQGSSFYKNKPPDVNAYTKDSEGHLCRFRASTAEKLMDVVGEKKEPKPGENAVESRSVQVYLAIKKRLPAGIFNLGSARLLKAAGKRAVKLSGRIHNCIDHHGEHDVLYFDDIED